MIRALDTVAALKEAQDLFQRVWRNPVPPVTAELMRAVEHAGGYAFGAYDGDAMVGASFAFLGRGPGGEQALHSHITGVVAEARGRHVGLDLKRHQRAWSLERGIETVTWTFDPLVRRNAVFNLARLRAVGVAYLVDFYGPMDDAINRGEPTDRLLVEWRLRDPRVVAALEGATAEEPRDGVRVPLPDDVERLRETDPAAARRWRAEVREALVPLLGRGSVVDGVTADGCLVVRP